MDQSFSLDFSTTLNGYRLGLYAGSQPDENTVWFNLEVRPRTLKEIQQCLAGLTAEGVYEAGLVRSSQFIFHFLVGDHREVHEALQAVRGPLVVRTDAPFFPWELFHDGQEFLGERLNMGRLPLGQLEPGTPPAPRKEGGLRMLIVVDPTDELDWAQQEATRLQGGLPDSLQVEVLRGKQVTADLLRAKLNSGDYDLVHLVGRLGYDAERMGGFLRLAAPEPGGEEGRYGAEDFFQSLSGRPVVLLSGSRRETFTEEDAPFLQITENLARAVLNAGALGVVVPQWDVDNHSSATLAEVFYTQLIEGQSVGEALRMARAAARLEARKAGRPDVNWAKFLLFGDPTAQLVVPASAQLYDKAGRLVRAHFNPSAQLVLDQLVQTASQVGASFLGSGHFLAALIAVSPWVRAALQKMNRDASLVAEQLKALLAQGHSPSEPLTLIHQSFSEHLRVILAEADALSAEPVPTQITDQHLALAFAHKPEVNSLELLRRVNLSPEIFLEALQGRAIPQEVPVGGKTPQPSEDLYLPNGQLNLTHLTPAGLSVMKMAADEAQQFGHLVVSTPHLFIALTLLPAGLTVSGIKAQGKDPDELRQMLRALVHQQPRLAEPPPLSRRTIASRVQEILRRANEIAVKEGGRGALVDERHLLLGFLEMQQSSTLQTLISMGLSREAFYRAAGVQESAVVPAADGESGQPGAAKPTNTPVLDRLGRDLTQAARDGQLNPVLGRKDEIQRLIQTLVRQQKNNAILIGEAGVGKTAVVEGLAQRIAAGKVPPQLKDKRILEIPISNLVSGTQYRGQFEEKLAALVREAGQADVIVFFDEIHMLVGAGQVTGGALDAGNILKPALARGDLHCIGATTPEEFARTIEKDSALERRFQPITVPELSPEATLEILKVLAPRYEAYYRVKIVPEALLVTVQLAVAHLQNRHLPDKAIDLLEETCAQVSVRSYSSSTMVVDGAPVVEMTDEITPERVAEVISSWTGIPVGGITINEGARLIDLEERLTRHIIGQPDAISAVAHALRMGRAGLRPGHQPLGVLLFTGPSGVGKTALAYAVAEEAFGSGDALFRLDMSEYMEQHSVAKLIGAPPGYIGFEGEGTLTGHLRHNPHGVVLFDEIEKAHTAVFDLLLQLFDAGRLTDAQGRLANGESTLYILTSNISPALPTKRGFGFVPNSGEQHDESVELLHAALSQAFRPEFLNRLDEVVVFNPLDEAASRQIVLLKLGEVCGRAAERGLSLMFEDSAMDLLIHSGISAEYGARYLQRAIDRLVNRPLSEMIVRGAHGSFICRASGEHLVFVPQPSLEQPNE